jgi:hypothetical protein
MPLLKTPKIAKLNKETPKNKTIVSNPFWRNRLDISIRRIYILDLEECENRKVKDLPSLCIMLLSSFQ